MAIPHLSRCELTVIDQDGTPVAAPPAKYGDSWMYIGNIRTDILLPGKSAAIVIALNRLALVTKSGTYRVTGTYNPADKNTAIVSAPIKVVVGPRTDAEMGKYIDDLSAKLKAPFKSNPMPQGGERRDELIQRLVFTCDRRIMPALIDSMYDGRPGNYWAWQALNYYLPADDRNMAAIVNAATERGMADGMGVILRKLGCPHEQIKKLIAISLSADHPAAWAEGALSAQQYCDDSFTPRLIAIATDTHGIGRDQAIYALASNRTDESVAALKKLLKDTEMLQFRGESIAQETAAAIRSAYLSHGNSDGRKLRPDDFGPEFQRPQ